MKDRICFKILGKQKLLRAWAAVVAAALITCLMLYGNLVAKRGGVVDDSILNEDDFYYQMDQKVKGFSSKGFKTGEAISFVIPFPQSITIEDLEFIKFFTDVLKGEFPEYGVLSLSVVPEYKDTGKQLLNTPYVNDQILVVIKKDPDLNMKKWLRAIEQDPGAYGLLIGRNFNYAQVIMLLPSSYDETQVFRKVAQFLEQRTIPAWEWNFKTDIRPAKQFERVLPAGWVMARGLMDAALTSDILKLSSVGLVLVAVAFFLSLASLSQSAIASLVIILCFIWVRGALGILQSLGFELYERVYFLLVYTAIIVSGISFAERKFEAFNEARGQSPGDALYQTWKKTGGVNEMILVTGLISFLNFITLYQIGVRGILEVGIFSALGIVFLLFLTLCFVPAFHGLLDREISIERRPSIRKASEKWNGILDSIVRECYLMLAGRGEKEFRYRRTAWAALSVTIMFVVVALTVIFLNYIDVRTKPMEYIPGTIIDKACKVLNEPGNYGFDRVPVLLMPKMLSDDGQGVYDPAFAQRVDQFKKRVLSLETTREANSVIDTLKVIARESYKSPMPITRQQMSDSLKMIEWDLGIGVKEQLWFNDGLAMFVSNASEDSNYVADLCENIIALNKNEFPDLDVAIFGKIPFYQRADKYIREGKPLNALTSQWIVIVIGALWIIWRNRRHYGHIRLIGWRTGFVLNTPFVFASAIIVLVMAILDVPIDQATACITALAINAAVDFGLYLIADYQTALLRGDDLRHALHYALVEKGRIITADIILNALCFAPLMVSSFIPVIRLGWIMIVMLIACGIGALLIMPALLPWCIRGKDRLVVG
jgi:predicted RND superfamily exporter protein